MTDQQYDAEMAEIRKNICSSRGEAYIYIMWLEAKHQAALITKESELRAKYEATLNAKENELRTKESEYKAALITKESELRVKEIEHKAALRDKESELRAKYEAALNAKESELRAKYEAALNAKENEYEAELKAKEETFERLQRDGNSQTQRTFSSPHRDLVSQLSAIGEENPTPLSQYSVPAMRSSPALTSRSDGTAKSASAQQTCLAYHEIGNFHDIANAMPDKLHKFATDKKRGDELRADCIKHIESSLFRHLEMSSKAAARTVIDMCLSCHEFQPGFLENHRVVLQEELHVNGSHKDYSTARFDYIWSFMDPDRTPKSSVVLEAKVGTCMYPFEGPDTTWDQLSAFVMCHTEFQQLRASMRTASCHFGRQGEDMLIMGGLIGFQNPQPEGVTAGSLIKKLVMYPAMLRSGDSRLHVLPPFTGVQALLAVKWMLMQSFLQTQTQTAMEAPSGSNSSGASTNDAKGDHSDDKDGRGSGSTNSGDSKDGWPDWYYHFDFRKWPPPPPHAACGPTAERRAAGPAPDSDLLDFKVHRYATSMQPYSIHDLVANIMTEDGPPHNA